MAQAQDFLVAWGPPLGALGGAVALFGCAVGMLRFKRWRRKALRERAPQSEKILRPAGWSSYQRLDEVSENLFMCVVMASGGGALAGLVAVIFAVLVHGLARGQITLRQIWADPKFYLVGFAALVGVVAALWALFWLNRLQRLFDETRYLKLGLRGEQAVAEKLMDKELAAAGYVAFHDLPGERNGSKWNVDHVVVGPGGIFVLETKARSRRRATREQDESKVIYDGDKLQFPWCIDWGVVEQARRNADWVRALVKEYGPAGIAVQPVIVVPGWYVESTGNFPVKAMNAKYLVGYLANAKRIYDARDLRGIVKRLDEVCRDLEF